MSNRFKTIAKLVSAFVLSLVMLAGMAGEARAKERYYDPVQEGNTRICISPRKWYQRTFKLKQKAGVAQYKRANGTKVNVSVYGGYDLVIREYRDYNDHTGKVVYRGYWKSKTFTFKNKVGKRYTCDLHYCGKAKGNVLIGPRYYVKMKTNPRWAWIN